jgi:hypothetical protein
MSSYARAVASQPNPEWDQYTNRIRSGEPIIPWRAVVWLLVIAAVLGLVVTIIELAR